MSDNLNKRILDLTKCVEALDLQQAQLATLSLVVEATIQKAHALIGALMEPETDQPWNTAGIVKSDAPAITDECIHPVEARIDAATMGSENKFYCGACDDTIDPNVVSREQLLGKEAQCQR